MMSEWKPIDSAPKDKRVLLYCGTHIKGFGAQVVAWWNPVEENWTYYVDETQVIFAHSPTHWMPLPAPPEASEGSDR